IKIGAYGDNVRSLESLFVRAMMLSGGALFDDNPGQFEVDMRRFEALQSAEVRAVSREWLSRPNYRLTVEPQAQYAAAPDRADRSGLPPMGLVGDLAMPPVHEGRLSNGVRVIHVERESTPTVELVMAFNAGG